MSDGLDAWRRRLALVRQALKENKDSAPTGGGGAPANAPAKPPDAPAAVPPFAADRGASAGAPFSIPPPKLSGGKGPRTVSVKQLRAEAKKEARLNGPRPPTPPVEDRPKKRGDCEGGPRPCALVGCRHHTAVEVQPTGSLVLNHPDKSVEELTASCSLDVADAGGLTLEETGAVLNLTRERVRQIEATALRKLADAVEPGRFKGSCKARCALSGRQCRLPAHDEKVKHRHERGEFYLVADEGQTTFAEKRRLEEAAAARTGLEATGVV